MRQFPNQISFIYIEITILDYSFKCLNTNWIFFHIKKRFSFPDQNMQARVDITFPPVPTSSIGIFFLQHLPRTDTNAVTKTQSINIQRPIPIMHHLCVAFYRFHHATIIFAHRPNNTKRTKIRSNAALCLTLPTQELRSKRIMATRSNIKCSIANRNRPRIA